MALIKCKECSNQVSTEADKCPHCGAKVKAQMGGCAKLAIIVGGFCLVVVVGGVFGPQQTDPRPARPAPVAPSEPPKPVTLREDSEAFVMAQMFVKESLKSPSTASFGGWFEQTARDSVKWKPNEGVYEVKLWVDSQNGFGATVRTDFVVKLRQEGKDRWTLAEPLKATQR